MNGELLLGNAYELIKSVPDHSVDLIVTDPPYLIEGSVGGTGILRDRATDYAEQLMGKGGHFLESVDMSILDDFVRVMKRINAYIWCNKEQIFGYLDYFVRQKNCNFEMLIFAKANPLPFTNGHYLKDKEYCLFFWEKGVKLYGDYSTLKTVWLRNIDATDRQLYGHPTIKPLDIIQDLIRNSSERGSTVLDPFMGSGTTAVACENLGRRWLGFEIDPEYHRIALDRLNGMTKKDRIGSYEQTKLF